ncbi:MAG: CopG family antitoxin [Patescibacteria group bacterium]
MKKKLKKFPIFKSDKEAEDFVANSDLTEYDISGFKPVHFEFEPKSLAVSVRLPEDLYTEVKKKAAKEGIKTQRFIRRALERAVS